MEEVLVNLVLIWFRSYDHQSLMIKKMMTPSIKIISRTKAAMNDCNAKNMFSVSALHPQRLRTCSTSIPPQCHSVCSERPLKAASQYFLRWYPAVATLVILEFLFNIS